MKLDKKLMWSRRNYPEHWSANMYQANRSDIDLSELKTILKRPKCVRQTLNEYCFDASECVALIGVGIFMSALSVVTINSTLGSPLDSYRYPATLFESVILGGSIYVTAKKTFSLKNIYLDSRAKIKSDSAFRAYQQTHNPNSM